MIVTISSANEARHLLSGKLIFGDERQIAAVRFLEALELAEETGDDLVCDECDGSGVIEVECEKCGGMGTLNP